MQVRFQLRATVWSGNCQFNKYWQVPAYRADALTMAMDGCAFGPWIMLAESVTQFGNFHAQPNLTFESKETML
jgi:hypothetical protein